MPESNLPDWLTTNFWFDPNPGPVSVMFQVFAITLAIEFAILVFASYRIDKYKTTMNPLAFKIFRRVIGTVGLFISLCLLLVFGRFIGIAVLSMRALLASVILIGFGLVLYFVYYMDRIYPKRIAELEQRAAVARYMPRPKPKSTGKSRDKKRKK